MKVLREYYCIRCDKCFELFKHEDEIVKCPECYYTAEKVIGPANIQFKCNLPTASGSKSKNKLFYKNEKK